MKKTVRPLAVIILILFIAGSVCVHAASGARLMATYISPITINDGSGPHSFGTPDSVAYTYSGSHALYDMATTYALDTVSHTSVVTGYDFYTYTSADSPLTDVAQTSSQATNGILDKEQYRFYYETTTAVPQSARFVSGKITLYPSPATSLITLSLDSESQGTVVGSLVDVTGKMWYQWSEPATANYSRQISIAELPAGVYYLRLKNALQSESKMLIVQH